MTEAPLGAKQGIVLVWPKPEQKGGSPLRMQGMTPCRMLRCVLTAHARAGGDGSIRQVKLASAKGAVINPQGIALMRPMARPPVTVR